MMRPGFLGFGYIHPVLGDLSGKGRGRSKGKSRTRVPNEGGPAWAKAQAKMQSKASKRMAKARDKQAKAQQKAGRRAQKARAKQAKKHKIPTTNVRADFVRRRAAFVTALAQARSLARSGQWKKLGGPLKRLQAEDAALSSHPGRNSGPQGNRGGGMPHLPYTRNLKGQAALMTFSNWLRGVGASRATRGRDPFSPSYYPGDPDV